MIAMQKKSPFEVMLPQKRARKGSPVKVKPQPKSPQRLSPKQSPPKQAKKVHGRSRTPARSKTPIRGSVKGDVEMDDMSSGVDPKPYSAHGKRQANAKAAKEAEESMQNLTLKNKK